MPWRGEKLRWHKSIHMYFVTSMAREVCYLSELFLKLFSMCLHISWAVQSVCCTFLLSLWLYLRGFTACSSVAHCSMSLYRAGSCWDSHAWQEAEPRAFGMPYWLLSSWQACAPQVAPAGFLRLGPWVGNFLDSHLVGHTVMNCKHTMCLANVFC